MSNLSPENTAQTILAVYVWYIRGHSPNNRVTSQKTDNAVRTSNHKQRCHITVILCHNILLFGRKWKWSTACVIQFGVTPTR